jgi:hypothetical protein
MTEETATIPLEKYLRLCDLEHKIISGKHLVISLKEISGWKETWHYYTLDEIALDLTKIFQS